MEEIPRLQIIRYAGNKSRLLDFLVPIIKNEMTHVDGENFVDLFAGTCSVSYALKSEYNIIANDIQEYSATIGRAILENDRKLLENAYLNDIEPYITEKLPDEYTFFQKNYSDTFFSRLQCAEIDGIRYAISKVKQKWKKNLYLTALISSMSSSVSSPGHFAEYFPSDKAEKERSRSIYAYFVKKCQNIKLSPSKNKSKNKFVLSSYDKLRGLKNADVIYADPPYSASHYSRFYHVLETAVKYDQPELNLECKGRYRNDRYFSPFSKKSTAPEAFRAFFEFISEHSSATTMVSYVNSNRGLVAKDELKKIAEEFYTVEIKSKKYSHSMQGSGTPKEVEEYVLICR